MNGIEMKPNVLTHTEVHAASASHDDPCSGNQRSWV